MAYLVAYLVGCWAFLQLLLVGCGYGLHVTFADSETFLPQKNSDAHKEQLLKCYDCAVLDTAQRYLTNTVNITIIATSQ